MSKVITFSRTFPKYHPKAGQPTYFVEKIWISLIEQGEISIGKAAELSQQSNLGNYHVLDIRSLPFKPKHHTIRSGNRWKVGDKFSPRVWSGKPYASPQTTIAPDIEIKKVFEIELTDNKGFKQLHINGNPVGVSIGRLAKNDGLEILDLYAWFEKPFKGQIICWNESVNY